MSVAWSTNPDVGERTLRTLAFLATDPASRAPVGSSPHSVVHRQGSARVLLFRPESFGVARSAVPLFVSMPLINTWTVFDLLPSRSVVRRLAMAGVPVYLLDWGRPGPEHTGTTLGHLIDGVLHRSLARVRRHAEEAGWGGEVDALGYCVGGTFLAVALSRHLIPVRRLALLCTPIDFHHGRLSAWADPATFPLEAVCHLGNFPRALMGQSFAWLRPAAQVGKWHGLWRRVEDDGFRELWAALERWNGDTVDFPGAAYQEYVRRCYFDNALMSPGTWVLDGRPVRLDQGRVPALAIAAAGDHICPPAAAFGLERAWGGPVHTSTLGGGHVGVCASPALPDTLLSWLGAEA